MLMGELSKELKNNLFSKRESIQEAYNYAGEIAKGCGHNEIYVLTAIHVLLNTISDEIEKCDDFKSE
jgi:hypothetical protein